MKIRNFVLVAALTLVASPAFAQGSKTPPQQKGDPERSGSAEDQAACRPAVRTHCSKLVGEGDLVILACLKEHRPKIGKACNDVLERNGQ